MAVTPDWAKRLTAGHWYAISGDTPGLGLAPTAPGTRYLENGDPAADPKLNPNRSPISAMRRLLGRYVKAPWSGHNDFSAITEAWNGAIYASKCGVSGSMVIFGGGHNDYFGSDVHTFDLSTREWHRISDGYITGNQNEYGTGAVYSEGKYPDGSPLPPHTYGYIQYDEVGNDLLLFKSQLELGKEVKPLAIPHLFNLDRREWRRGPCHPTAYLGAGGWTAWDGKRRILWGNSGDGSDCFIGFSPDKENPDGTFGYWGECFPGKLPGSANHCVMAYDPKADLLLIVDHNRNQIGKLKPEDPRKPVTYLSTLDGIKLAPHAAMEYSPHLDSLIYYSANDGAKIWRIQCDFSNGETVPEDEPNRIKSCDSCHYENLLNPNNQLDPIKDAAQQARHPVHIDHTYGRFRIASFDKIELIVLIRHIDTPVYVMRIA